MENQPTPTGLRKALDAVVGFVKAYSILSFVLFLLAIVVGFFVVPAAIDSWRKDKAITGLESDKKALQARVDLLRPKCPCDTLTP